MLTVSAILLGLAALFGLGLLALHQWVRPIGWMRLPGLGHGLVGLAGLATLLGALGGPGRGERMGVASFGIVAAVLFGLAVAAAAAAYVARRRASCLAPLALGLHATMAVAGLTLLAAYLSAPS